jgi:hypothetical protein
MLTEQPTIGQAFLMQRKHMADRHCRMMEKILEQNASRDKYWILGYVKSKRKNGQTRIVPHMTACYEMPQVTKESYLYEVDNIAGTKQLLWVMHPNDKLDLPSLGKSIHVAGE